MSKTNKQITEDYVSFEIAKLLKEKGFKEIVQSLWVGEDEYHYISTESIKSDDYNSGGTCLYSAPTHQMALKWLREVHAICIEVCRNINTFYYSYRVIQGSSFVKLLGWSDSYDTYEQAVEAALLYVLKNLI